MEMGIAERVDISEDGKRYVFYLRKTYWSDGAPLTAADFETSWKQILTPGGPTVCSYLFYPILNAESAVRGEKSIKEVGIRALDELTLEVLLERKTPYFLSLTSFPSFLPTPQHRLDRIDSPPSLSSSRWISNGPFLLDQFKSQSLVLLRKNPTFWQAEQIKLDGISIFIIPHDTTALEMFERGELDWLGGHLSGIPADALPSLQDKLQYSPMAASTFCTFNTEKVPFSNENIRKAFSLATDKAEIAREILPTDQILATRYVPPSLCGGKNRVLFPPFNPDLAKEHLRKGLMELQNPIGPVSIHYRPGGIDGRLAQVLKEMWEKTLGIPILLIQTDGKTHKDCLHRRSYEIALSCWIAQYSDPINILERFKSRTNAKNYCSWEDPEFAFLLDLAQEAPDPFERTEFLERAEEILADAVPMIPLYHWSNPSIFHPRLRNMQTGPGGGPLFERCWLAD
jgi:oligopeptide transport system substrate-binding protein